MQRTSPPTAATLDIQHSHGISLNITLPVGSVEEQEEQDSVGSLLTSTLPERTSSSSSNLLPQSLLVLQVQHLSHNRFASIFTFLPFSQTVRRVTLFGELPHEHKTQRYGTQGNDKKI